MHFSHKVLHELIYFDNAATVQKSEQVLDMLNNFYKNQNAPVKRGMYQLAEEATALYEQARAKVASFINAHPDEIIFNSGATEGINNIATTWAADHLKKGDEIVLTMLEHHSNLLPWHYLAKKIGIVLKFISINQDGSLNLANLASIITSKTKLVSFLSVSNAIGTHVPVEIIVKQARSVGARVLIDAAQSAPLLAIDVKKMDPDFLVFSGHKLGAPTGIGVLYIKKSIQHEVRPYKLGGGMVSEVSFDSFIPLNPPHCFEAGTPPIAQVIGLGAAIDYLQTITDKDAIIKKTASLCSYLIDQLKQLPEITILGPIEQLSQKGHLVSFTHKKYHPHDIGAYLDQHQICVRTGHHCAQPLARALDIEGSVRASFYWYNSVEQVEKLVYFLKKLS